MLGKPRRVPRRCQLPCVSAVDLLLRVDADVVGRCDAVLSGQELERERGGGGAQRAIRVRHTVDGNGGVARLSHRDREPIQCLLCERVLREIEGNRDIEIARQISLHDERIRMASEHPVPAREQLPDRMIRGAVFIGAFGAENGVFRIALVQEILRGKDVCALGVRRRLPIGGESGEKVVVVGFFFCACQKLLKEIMGAGIVVPKYAKIVGHRASFLFLRRRREYLPIVSDLLHELPYTWIEERTQLRAVHRIALLKLMRARIDAR